MMIDTQKLQDNVEAVLNSIDDPSDMASMIVIGFDHQGNPKISYTGNYYDLAKAATLMQCEFMRYYFGIED